MLRWAVLGTGFISNTVIGAIGQSDRSQVELIAGRSPDRVAAFQAEHGIARGTTDLQAAVSDPDIDAVYIGLPNHAHHEPAIAAAAAGKAILSEKSLTTSMATARQLIDGVQANDALFVEGLMYLAHPLYRRVVDLLGDGRLGPIRSITGRYAADIWQVVNPAGKGTIYNLGCYPVSLLHLVVQTACGDEVFADRTLTAVGNINDDGNVCDAALSVRFGNGLLATLQSTDSFGNGSDFAITGERGVLRFETNPWLPVVGHNVLTFQPFEGADGDLERIVVSDPHDAFYHQVKLIERCVAEGLVEAPRPSPRHRDSLEIMAMLTDWEAACLAPAP